MSGDVLVSAGCAVRMLTCGRHYAQTSGGNVLNCCSGFTLASLVVP